MIVMFKRGREGVMEVWVEREEEMEGGDGRKVKRQIHGKERYYLLVFLTSVKMNE